MDTTPAAPSLPRPGAPTPSGLAIALLPSAAFLAADHLAGLAAGILAAASSARSPAW